MKRIITDRGVQASASTGVLLAVLALATHGYRPVWLALGIAWVIATAAAVVLASRRGRAGRQGSVV